MVEINSPEVHRKARLMRAVGGLFILLLAVTMALTVIVILRQGQKLDAATSLIAECTTPPLNRVPPVKKPRDGDCWVRTNSQTQDVVSDISAISIAAAACGAAHPGNVDATRECVVKTLASQ